jgi:hypothetical protein
MDQGIRASDDKIREFKGLELLIQTADKCMYQGPQKAILGAFLVYPLAGSMKALAFEANRAVLPTKVTKKALPFATIFLKESSVDCR